MKSSESSKQLIIAIDGPSGAGKSSVARLLAKRLGYRLIETGLIYRAMAWSALERGIALEDESQLITLFDSLTFEYQTATDGSSYMVINGQKVKDELYHDVISMGASQVSRHPKLRQALLTIQRALGERGGVVMEGRDIGTVVYPNADFKFFITADLSVRASRRISQRHIGQDATLSAQTTENMATRDKQDESRTSAPLKPADDAYMLDTTKMSLEEVVDHLEANIAGRAL